MVTEPSLDGSSLTEPLTPRQEDVLRLMVEGLSNREIGEVLFVAEGTVKAHVNQIFGKLMVRSRAEAIAPLNRWPRTGLLVQSQR